MLTLPTITQDLIGMSPINWDGLTKRFMNPNELECVIALLRRLMPKTVLEFGVNTGRTAKAILNNIPSVQKYVGIDVPVGFIPEMKVQRNEVPAHPGHMVQHDKRFSLLLPASGSQSLMPKDFDIRFDAVFIDGDHSYQGVMHDTMLSKGIIAEGGIIIWHDYHDLGSVDVREALHDLAAGGDTIWHVDGTWLAFQRVWNSNQLRAAQLDRLLHDEVDRLGVNHSVDLDNLARHAGA